jgi:hypothetical protein
MAAILYFTLPVFLVRNLLSTCAESYLNPNYPNPKTKSYEG